jgi:hypothetical protein
MSTPDSFVENIVARCVPAIRKDAESLVSVAAWGDAPAGVVLLPMSDADGLVGGSCLGSGETLARVHGCREGAIAVRLNVAAMVRSALADAAGDTEQASELARIICEAVACHEVAHAVVAPADEQLDGPEAIALVERAARRRRAGYSAAVEAGHHDARWAAANVVMQRRAMALRPAWERRPRETFLRRDLERYGHELDAIANALGAVAEGDRIRELLAPGSAAARRVEAACRPDAERTAIIEQGQRQRAAGELVAS